MNQRQEINRQILDLLRGLNEEYSDQRFNQLLSNFISESGREINFYEESIVTMTRLVERIDGRVDTN